MQQSTKKDDFKIRDHNIRPHVDIELDIIEKREGNVTFTLRINAGNIVDYNLVEYIDVKRKYGRLNQTTAANSQESGVSRSTGTGSSRDSVRSNNL